MGFVCRGGYLGFADGEAEDIEAGEVPGKYTSITQI